MTEREDAVSRPAAVEGMQCPEEGCGGVLELRESQDGPFYGCTEYPECDATHGAHPDGRPLGVPGDKATKRARQRAHQVFDRLWQNAPQHYHLEEEVGTPEHGQAVRRIQQVARVRAYRWLADVLRLPEQQAHIGSLDRFGCQLVVQLCRDMDPSKLRAWYKRRQVRAWQRGHWPDGTEYSGAQFTQQEVERWSG